MKLAGKLAIAGTVGVFAGAARGDDVPWRTPGVPPVKARAAAPADKPVPAAALWKPLPADDPNWQPARGPANAPAPPPATVPVLVPLPLPVSVGVQAKTPPEQPSAPTPPLPTVPPIVIPKVVPPPAKPESAPSPRPAPFPSPTLPAPSLPAPRPVAEEKKDLPKPTIVPAAAADVWGAYAPCDAAKKGTCAVPVRHGTYGSPDLRLSRDHHVLDGLMKPITGESEKLILKDTDSVADRFFVQTEYLSWWTRQASIPALATTATNRQFGFFGQPGTTLLLGPGGFGPDRSDGFRVRAGGWVNDAGTVGLDGSYFFLGERTESRSLGTPQFPTILRPFFAPNLNREFGELVSFPGLSTGTLDVTQSSELWGADVNLRCAILCGCDRRLAAFAGYRHLSLREDLSIREALTAGPAAPDPVGTRIVVQDRFAVRNQFHGGQVGVAGGRRWGRISLDGRASVALGSTHQVLDISGSQTRTRPGMPAETFTGGLLATGPNLGRFTRDKFSVVPEATLSVGYFLTPNLQVYLGYNYLYWTNMIRPGDQIDRVVDLTFVPNAPAVPVSGTNRPQPTFRQTDFWAQGIQVGLEWRW